MTSNTTRAAKSPRTLSVAETRSLYDAVGVLQDLQLLYDRPAIAALIRLSAFDRASSVFEFGCGTGRLAYRLLSVVLPAGACYLGVDLSPSVVAIAQRRVHPWKDRATVRLSDGSIHVERPDQSVDRVVSTYVLDLLDEAAIVDWLDEAWRVLKPDGRLCVVTFTRGRTALGRLITRAWTGLFSALPWATGGSRPIDLGPLLRPDRWDVVDREVVESLGTTSAVIIARRLADLRD